MKKDATIQSVAKTCWHIERKINEILERITAIEAAMLGLAGPSDYGLDPDDDAWTPPSQIIPLEGLVA